jgi:signal-transduction protein with cAMP-binding, CBS, and nucleotidyltransferase domain
LTASEKEIAMRVNQICTHSVVTCRRDTSALELAVIMRDRHVGDVIVVDDDGDGGAKPVGIVTDRDLVVRVMAQGVDPGLLKADDLVRDELEIALDSEFAFDAICRMRGKGVRRLPVVDSRCRLIGILAADDVVRFLTEELSAIARIMPRQIQREEAELEPLASDRLAGMQSRSGASFNVIGARPENAAPSQDDLLQIV